MSFSSMIYVAVGLVIVLYKPSYSNFIHLYVYLFLIFLFYCTKVFKILN